MDMRDIILKQSEQIRTSLEVNRDVRVEGTFDGIVLAGMGGSALPGDLLNALHVPSVPLLVHRDYNLPHVLAKSPLVLCSTYSGNTEETLSAYTAARQAGYTTLANTAGGKLAELSAEDGIPIIKIAFANMQPRHTLLASFTSIATALKNSGVAEDVTQDLNRVADVLDQIVADLEEPAQELAGKLKGTVPLYTASSTLAFAAKNFKIQTNENAKTPAFWNEFPELNHNEMASFAAKLGNWHVVILRDADDHPRTQARMDVTAEIYREWGLGVSEVAIQGQTLLEKIAYAIVFELWTTYHLAQLNNIDPVPITSVEDFKQRLVDRAGKM